MALARAPDGDRGDRACSAPRGPAPPRLALAGTAGAPTAPSPGPELGDGGGAARAVLASSAQLGACRPPWAGALRARCAPWGTSGDWSAEGPVGRAGGRSGPQRGYGQFQIRVPDGSERFILTHPLSSIATCEVL